MATSELKDFRGKQVKIIVAETKIPSEHMIGKFATPDDYDILVESDTDCYIKPSCDVITTTECNDESNCAECIGGVNEENVAFIFRKNFFTEEEQLGAYNGLRDAAQESDNRGMAAGTELSPMQGNRSRATQLQFDLLEFMMNPFDRIDGGDTIDDLLAKYKDDPVLQKEFWVLDDMDEGFEFDSWLQKVRHLPRKERAAEATRVRSWIGESMYANKVKSGVAGYFDRYPRIPFLRPTAYTEKNPEKFEKSIPFLERLNEGFKKMLPKRWAAQREAANKIDEGYLIGNTVFTTLTVNSKFRTAYHLDAGDLGAGFSNLCVVSNDGKYTGGYLTFPEYRVAVNVRPGDLLLVANHSIIHGNQEFHYETEESDRVSLVAYFRENMLYGGTMDYEEARREFVKKNSKDTTHPMWKPRFNGVVAGMWSDNETNDPEVAELARPWYEFMKTKPNGEIWIDKYHPWLRTLFENKGLEEFFG